jgi:glycosyltransferase involved in cell wall biosynthesis
LYTRGEGVSFISMAAAQPAQALAHPERNSAVTEALEDHAPAGSGEGRSVSIVMPCLNEIETLRKCVLSARAAIESAGVQGEVIVADNGSTDGSQEAAAAEGARVIHVPERGYGAAVRAGIEAARGEYVLMADADASYDFSHLQRFVAALDAGADLVMGNRFMGGIQTGAMPMLHRYLGNPVLSFLGRLFFRAPVGDFHCGMRAFRKEAIQGLHLNTAGMEFASEMVVKASLAKLAITEVPTTLSPDGRSRPPHLRTWRDGWRHLRFLLLYTPRWLFLYPGALLMLLGAGCAAWLIPGERTIGGVRFDVDTLAYALGCILIGFHIFIFAISAKVFAISEGLLPPDSRFERWFKRASLEAGLILGCVLLAIGIGAGAYALAAWRQSGFGNLSPTHVLRITLPSMTAVLLGIEMIFSSFFLSILRMKSR